jgi:hypothetical protein
VQGRQVPAIPPHSLDGWQYVMTELGDVDVLLRALDLLGAELAPSSRQRALSTLRGLLRLAGPSPALAGEPVRRS